MNIEELRNQCMQVKGATESLPFIRHDILVFKVMDKMFAFIGIEPKDGRYILNLKCDAQRSVELREQYKGIGPGHHPETLLWNGVNIDSDVPDKVIIELIHHSVDEVIKKLSKAKQKEYNEL